MPENVCLIVPCFNEAARLDVGRFIDTSSSTSFMFVNDGSSDDTAAMIAGRQSNTVRLLNLDRHVGKAEAVRQGMLHAARSGLLDRVAWVGYWDADLAAPVSEVAGFLAYAGLDGRHVDAIFGSRIYKLGSRIRRSYVRHLAGRVFATIASAALDLEAYDTQCGAKLFRSELVPHIFGEPFLSRWIFDVEILLRLEGRRVIEYPLGDWADVGGSKLRILSVIVPTLMDIYRLRKRALTRQG